MTIDPAAVDAAIAGVECPDCRGHLLTAKGMFEAAVKQGAVIEGHRTEIAQLRERLAEAEEVLRSLACTYAAGGYNAETVDPEAFQQKIVSGVDMIVDVETKRRIEAEKRLAEAERKAEDMKQRNQWLRSRWDLMPNDLRKNARYKVLEDLDSCLECLRTIRSHLDCGGSVAQAVAELDAIIGKVGE